MGYRKFGRKCRVLIQSNTGTDESKMQFIEVTDPFTIEFNIDRNVNNSLNTINLSIYNLKKTTRQQIFQDRLTPIYRRLIVQAGYDQLVTIFQGNIISAFSSRNGADIVTTIDGQDGGFDATTANIAETFSRGATLDDLLNSAFSTFEVLTKGFVDTFTAQKSKATIADGKTVDFIKSNNVNYYVDLEKVNVLPDNAVIDVPVIIFNRETGLLGTPQRQETYIEVQVLFEPYVRVGQVVEIQSEISSEFDGVYKVLGIKHSGVISGAQGGALTTSLSLLMPNALGGFKKVKE